VNAADILRVETDGINACAFGEKNCPFVMKSL
jgi:hypothetical protein